MATNDYTERHALNEILDAVTGTGPVDTVRIDQTTPGTTNNVSVATGQGAGATIGAVADAAVATDAAGTLSAKLRGIVKLLVEKVTVKLDTGSNIVGRVGIDQTTPGTTDSVSVATAQGAGAAIGAISGAAVVTDANGTIQQYLRGIVKLLVDKVTVKLDTGTNVVGRVGIDQSTNGTTNAARAPSVACATADVNAPAANTAAVVTYAASEGAKHVISGLAWSYDADPTGGNIKVADDGNTVFTIDIATKGAGFFTFPHPKVQATANKNLVITLAAGGDGITGKVSILNHWTE